MRGAKQRCGDRSALVVGIGEVLVEGGGWCGGGWEGVGGGTVGGGGRGFWDCGSHLSGPSGKSRPT